MSYFGKLPKVLLSTNPIGFITYSDNLEIMASSKKQLSPRGRWIFGLLFVGFASIFLAVGSGMAWTQERRLRVAQKIPAVIETSTVESHRGSKGSTSYQPKVGFHYRVSGTDYHADSVYPLSGESSSDAAAAQAVVQQFQPGQEVTAWYDPYQPSSAFLIYHCSFFPYISLLIPMIHIAVGLSIAMLLGVTPTQRAKRLGLITGIWWAVGILSASHYALAGGIFSTLPTVVLGIYAGVGCGWLLVWRKLAWRKMTAGIATTATPASSTSTDEPNPIRTS